MQSLKGFGVEFHKTKLNNGVDLFLFRRVGMPIYLRALFFAGSRFDDISGTAHFLEHLITSGTKEFPSKNLIAEYIQKMGGEFGASTNSTIIRFNIEIPEAEDLDYGIKVLDECINNSLFDEKTIENERGAIQAELKGKKSNPKTYIWDLSREITLQDSKVGRSTLGTGESISEISKQNLLSFKESFLNTGRMCIVVSGDVDMAQLTEKLNRLSFQTGERFIKPEAVPIVLNKKEIIEHYPGDNIQAILSSRTNIENYKEYCALRVLNSIMSIGRGSRLVTLLRYKNGLVYSISGHVMNAPDWGSINIEFGCDKNNFSTARDLIYEEFENLKKNNVSAEELENAKSRIKKGSKRLLQTSESWVTAHEDDCLFNPESIHTIEDYLDTITDLTLEDLDLVIKKYLQKENFVTALCGNI